MLFKLLLLCTVNVLNHYSHQPKKIFLKSTKYSLWGVRAFNETIVNWTISFIGFALSIFQNMDTKQTRQIYFKFPNYIVLYEAVKTSVWVNF